MCTNSTPTSKLLPHQRPHTGGFYINSESVPAWLAWIKYLSFVYYAFAGLLISQIQDECCWQCENVCNTFTDNQCVQWIPAPGCLHTGNQILRRYGYGGWYAPTLCGHGMWCTCQSCMPL